ncbi:MAG: hypothetical protein HKN33_02350 [Pyrinomonadaceae bacterium]|nr:hypothetical protein [Pyrinomonadaceae bacterium]
MKILKSSLLFSFILTLAVSAFAQSEFSDRNVEYTFSLPNDTWKMTVKPSDVSPNVEYVYKYRNQGHLEIRKLKVEKNSLYGDIIRQEEQSLQFLPGYVAGREENFKGALSGRAFNYEFLRGGKNMSGRYYFLKSDETSVYVLRFTGLKDILRSIRNETDFIARSFNVNTEE